MNRRPANFWRWAVGVILLSGLIWIFLSRSATTGLTQANQSAPRQGFSAPDFNLATASGEQINLAELRGQPVLINFWASWCTPCRAEMPAIQRLYQDYHPKGLEVLAINSTSQDSPQKALALAAELGLTFPILFDESGNVSQKYQVGSLPSSFFIDPQGIIQEVVIGGPMSEALLRIRVEQLFSNQEQDSP